MYRRSDRFEYLHVGRYLKVCSWSYIVYRMRSRDISPDSGLRNQFRRKVVLLLLLLLLLPSLLSSCFSRVFGVFGPLFPFLIIPFPLFLSYLSRRRPFNLVVFKSIEVIEVNSQNRIRDSSGKKEWPSSFSSYSFAHAHRQTDKQTDKQTDTLSISCFLLLSILSLSSSSFSPSPTLALSLSLSLSIRLSVLYTVATKKILV